MHIPDLSKYGGSKEIIEALSSAGLKEFYPPQELAIKEGLLKSMDSFVISAPTASGKTLIEEMAALKTFFEKRQKKGQIYFLEERNV